MSWSVEANGTQDEALAKVNADPHVDASVKVAVRKALCAFNGTKAVKLRTHGHIGPDGAGNALIQIDTV